MQETDAFKKWIRKLRDRAAVGVVTARLTKLALGNPGDVAPVGEGVSELKIDYGPGYRVYYKIFECGIIILLGGDKSSQPSDVKKAKRLAREVTNLLAEKS